MIAKIEGTLIAVASDHARVALPGGLTLEVLLPAFTVARLHASEGEALALYTTLFFESQAQGATMIPRLAGFLSEQDRAFYQLFVTCKGIGYRRALRAMALSSERIAGAIADRDIRTLQSMPEIGKRTAETICATLHDKVDEFTAPGAGGRSDDESGAAAVTGATASSATGEAPRRGGALGKAALDVLVQLGENRSDAIAWIDQVMAQDDPPQDEESLLAAVYRVKAGG